MNLVQLRGLLSWQHEIGFRQALTQTKYLYKWATLTGKGKAKPSFKKKRTKTKSHTQTPFRSFTYSVFGKTCERFRHFTLISHTYLDTFLYFCEVFYKWRTTYRKVWSTHWHCTENHFDILSKIFHDTLGMHVCINTACVRTPQGNGIPDPGTAANKQGRSSADRSTIFLCSSLSKMWKTARQVTAVFGTSSPMPT